MLFRLVTAWLCNLIDIIATIYFYTNFDGEELNPISAWFLSQSVASFIFFKITVFTLAVLCIWWKRELKFFVQFFRYKITLPFFEIASWILLIEYLLVVIYYLVISCLLFM